MRILHFDCFSGIAGDMVVGALRDLGVGEEVFRAAIAALGLDEPAGFHRGSRQGIAGWKFEVHTHDHAPHHHHHHHHEHSHGHPHAHGRTHAQIRELLDAAPLEPAVRARSLAVFHRIAVAEGRIHGVPPEDVGFHEVGAVDSIADIVCACAGIESLGAGRVTASALVEGSGTIACAHGTFPLPAPATLAILEGIPLSQASEPGERITPTGAAILAEYASGFGPMPAMRPLAYGFGLGSRDTPGRPNVLRAILGDAVNAAAEEADEVVLIEANLDDMTPELAGAAAQALIEAGALDAWFTPAFMKKGRPAFVLGLLAAPHDADSLANRLLRETTAFGVRMSTATRRKLARDTIQVSTPFGPIPIKRGTAAGTCLQASPEFDACRTAALAAGVPVLDVWRAALAAAQQPPTTPCPP